MHQSPHPLFSERHERLWSLIYPQIETEDLAHDPLHILRVYHWTCRLAPEANANVELSGAAALLHDLINIPKESQLRSTAADASANASHPWLIDSGYSKEECRVVMDAIRTCSWSKGASPLNPEGLALQEADRLDAIGAIGVMRNAACAQAMKRRGNSGSFYHRADPLATSERSLNDRHYAIDHFRIKLLKIAESLSLPSAKLEGVRRHKFMLSFLENLEYEIPHPNLSSGLSRRQH
ncbi:MAG: HD domain-containing protein [Myxococcota bacterium]